MHHVLSTSKTFTLRIYRKRRSYSIQTDTSQRFRISSKSTDQQLKSNRIKSNQIKPSPMVYTWHRLYYLSY